jgi:hypothetical protein
MSDDWTKLQIDEHLKMFGVLVLFALESTFFGPEIKLVVYGDKISEFDKMVIKEEISDYYGGDPITTKVCVLINELALRWYNKNILKKKARVVNKKKVKE